MTDDPPEGLAAERTALAWNRTGMAFIVLGAVVMRLLPPTAEPFAGGVGAVMALTGVVTAAFAWRPRARPAAERAVRWLALATTLLAAAAAGAALWR